MSSIEDHMLYRKGDYIEICIAPADHEQYYDNLLSIRLAEFSKFFNEKLKLLVSTCSDYVIVLEMSRTGRLHYHAVLQVGQPLSLANVIANLKYSGKGGQKRLIAVYGVSDATLPERIKYITKDIEIVDHYFVKADGELTELVKEYVNIKKYKPKVLYNEKITLLDFINKVKDKQ